MQKHPFTKFADGQTGAAITVKVTPHAPRTAVAGIMGDGTIKIQVAAPAEEGRANQALIEFLAATLGISAGSIDIVAGQTSERKLISLLGVTPGVVEEKLGTLARAGAAAKKARPAKKAAKPKPAKAKKKK